MLLLFVVAQDVILFHRIVYYKLGAFGKCYIGMILERKDSVGLYILFFCEGVLIVIFY